MRGFARADSHTSLFLMDIKHDPQLDTLTLAWLALALASVFPPLTREPRRYGLNRSQPWRQ